MSLSSNNCSRSVFSSKLVESESIPRKTRSGLAGVFRPMRAIVSRYQFETRKYAKGWRYSRTTSAINPITAATTMTCARLLKHCRLSEKRTFTLTETRWHKPCSPQKTRESPTRIYLLRDHLMGWCSVGLRTASRLVRGARQSGSTTSTRGSAPSRCERECAAKR